MQRFLAALLVHPILFVTSSALAQSPITVLPLTAENQIVLAPTTLGILVNANDQQSIELGQQYARIRGVPPSNIIKLKLPRVNYVARHLMVRELERLHHLPNYSRLAGFALAFDKPYRVDSNQSITSAISQGIATMTWKGSCNVTQQNPDAGAPPGASLHTKPAMLLFGGGGLAESVAVAERGKSADAADPLGEVFFVKTSDVPRSGPREASMDRAQARLGQEIAITVTKAQTLSGRSNVMGFQIGLPVLKDLDTLHFLPGAFADHLTSFGGAIGDNKTQTAITALIRAGATASFGTVREPCNFPGKFPNPERLLSNYLHGDSILEAYWKSIDMVTEGLLVGEPLSRPFPVADARLDGNVVTVKANRHTKAYLENARSAAQDMVQQAGQAASFDFGMYDVQRGTPRFLRDFRVSGDLKPGDLIGSFEVDDSNMSGLSLGILPRG
ncbi:uncharacterized protein (TIGR03790 family) [Rhizobium azibense]|uniref:Uncharacterized protein (TIGR03790 family) n=1 Tax=Rhizobium azibense TaxID=1136135 RepID=A0A4R3Q362_9HYPH|nr:TIGR03790 family protein [Rhizobium azibense]TCU15451.1 uncharacterized protein (TIGR03790 family) [Rhizobium azibense]